MSRTARRSGIAVIAAAIIGVTLALAWPAPLPLVAQEVNSIADPSRARPVRDLPDPYRYVVPPSRISPDAGVVPGDGPPFFREPHLLVNELGMVAVFMETPPANEIGRRGWSCSSERGRTWACTTIPLAAEEGQFVDFADPWLADTRGDPCPTYGAGITLAALRRTGNPTAEGVVAGDNPAQTVAYYSTDMGRTWQGPETIPEPAIDIGPDGSKVTFTGRTYVGYRSFIQTGIYVSRLGTDADPCAFSEPLELTEANDHPRFSSTAEPGAFAVRGVTPGAVTGGSTLTFNRFGPGFETQLRDVPVAGTTPLSLIPAFCTSDGTCRTGADVAQTLMYDPVRDRYHHVYTDRPTPAEGNALDDLVTRYNFSDDGGLTWSLPVAVAGSGAEFSEVGASSLQPTLAWDAARETLLLAYYEKPSKDSLLVELRVRLLGPDDTWTPPVTVDETPYVAYTSPNDDLVVGRPFNGEPENRFGDYFGFQARDGVFHVAHHPLDEDGTGSIAYLSVRYAPAETRDEESEDDDDRDDSDQGPGDEDEGGNGGGDDGDGDEGTEDDGRDPDDRPDDQEREATFVRESGATRTETAAEVSKTGFDQARTVVLARADAYPDALTGAPLATSLDAPVLLTNPDELSDAAAAEIDRLEAERVVMLGGEAAISPGVEQHLVAKGLTVERIGGADRFATAVLIAEELGEGTPSAFLAEGANDDPGRGFPDPLSVAPYAAFTGRPVLLGTRDAVPPVTAAALDKLGVSETVVVGGSAALSEEVFEQLADGGHGPRRLAGADRYATSVAVYSEGVRAGMDPGVLWLATGLDFPDALAAGPTIAELGQTLLLVDGRDLTRSPATEQAIEANRDLIDTVRLVGGTAAISPAVEERIRDLLR